MRKPAKRNDFRRKRKKRMNPVCKEITSRKEQKINQSKERINYLMVK